LQGLFIFLDDDLIAMIMKYLPWLIALLYFICPYDVLPDFLVGPGWLDDVGVFALAWWWATRIRRTYQTRSGPWPRGTYRQGSPGANSQAAEDPYKDEDPYKILGIERGAPKDEIKTAYKRLAARYHPDKVQHLGKEFQELANKKFVAIQKAYDMLMR
jgi:uncharacterized membrane protein YkvA (DUF1232 family)